MNRLGFIFLTLTLFSALNVMAAGETCDSLTQMTAEQLHGNCTGAYYDWGRAQNGWGYCYERTCYGDTLNNGQPVSEFYCR